MPIGDVVDGIGKLCELEYCGKLDLLPFPCDACEKYVRVLA